MKGLVYKLIFIYNRPPMRTARMSLQHIPSLQHYARLSLVPEAPSPKLGLPMPTGQPEQQQQNDSSLRPTETLSTRTNSDTDLYAPIRRRSLLQHGVATRNSWTEDESKKSLLSQAHAQSDLQSYYYKPTKPIPSKVATPKSEDNLPGRRVATPNDLDYGHIGAYKLGSLRITNGTASPTPSVERPVTMSGRNENTTTEESRGSAQGHRHGLSQRSNTISVLPEIVKPPWITRAESPLRQEYVEEYVEEERDDALAINTHLPLPEFSQFKFTDAVSPTSSLDLARDYMNDLARSPFSFEESPPASPILEATSKHMAVEDDLFEPEPGTPEIPKVRGHESFDSGYPAEVVNSQDDRKVRGPRELTPKPLAKADSGYSSNVSLRSFKGSHPPSIPVKEAPPTPPKPVRVPSSTYSVSSSSYSVNSEKTIRPQRSLPALPNEDNVPAQSSGQPPPIPPKNSDARDYAKLTPDASLPSKLPEQNRSSGQSSPRAVVKPQQKHGRSQSIPNIPSVARMAQYEYKPNYSPTSSEIPTSTSSSASTSKWRPRSKSRSQSMLPPPPIPVFTVQAFRTPSEQLRIPPVSAEAARRLEKRVDAFPVACFPNTERGSPNMRRTASKETLGTIFSVGSAEWKEELTYSRLQSSLPAVPVHESIPEVPTPDPIPNRRHTFQPLAPQSPPRKAVRQSLQPSPRSNPALEQKIQEDFEMQITSLDNISSSLGRSPYDLAISPTPDTKRKQQARAKSMTAQFEADAAARFVRARTTSQEFYNSHDLKDTTSYDPVANQNPWTGGSDAVNSKAVSGDYSPQTHNNRSGRVQSVLLPRKSIPNLRADNSNEEKRHSFMSTESARIKSPPPVSMQTQRKIAPTQIGSHSVIPSSRTPPQSLPPSAAPPPDRTPPQPPADLPQLIPNESEKEVHDPWAKQRDFWASKKQEALQSRKSIEVRRPVIQRPSFDHPGPRSESARPSVEYHRPQILQNQTLSHHISFENPHHQSYGYESSQYAEAEKEADKGYDHTYGSYDHDKENTHSHQMRQEYYDGPSQQSEDIKDQRLSKSITNNSTSDMLILDRFAGGLGYGYEPGFGLVGSAGTRSVGKMANASRKSVGESLNYGLDFSDVPVFLQRVKIEG